MITVTREDAVTPGRWLQAGDVQGHPYVLVGTNDGTTAWLQPEEAREFGTYLVDLADRVAANNLTEDGGSS